MRQKLFTGGEWVVPHFANENAVCNCEYVLAEGQDHVGSVATVHYCKPGKEEAAGLVEARANARLIGSAPKMYELLEAMVNDGNKTRFDTAAWLEAATKLLDFISPPQVELSLEEAMIELGRRGIELRAWSSDGTIIWESRQRNPGRTYAFSPTWHEAVSAALGYKVVPRAS